MLLYDIISATSLNASAYRNSRKGGTTNPVPFNELLENLNSWRWTTSLRKFQAEGFQAKGTGRLERGWGSEQQPVIVFVQISKRFKPDMAGFQMCNPWSVCLRHASSVLVLDIAHSTPTMPPEERSTAGSCSLLDIDLLYAIESPEVFVPAY